MASSFFLRFSLLAMDSSNPGSFASFGSFCPWFFSRYFLLGSPSLAWDDGAFFRLEEEGFLTRDALKACVYACCGSKEPSQLQILPKFQQQLESRAYPELSITVEVVEGHSENSCDSTWL